MTMTLKLSNRPGSAPRSRKLSPPPAAGRRMSPERLQYWLDCQTSPFARKANVGAAAKKLPSWSPRVAQ